MAHDDDRWALRAEVEARNAEIALLRGVVAALRGATAKRRATAPEEGQARCLRWMVLSCAVGAVLGIAFASMYFAHGPP